MTHQIKQYINRFTRLQTQIQQVALTFNYAYHASIYYSMNAVSLGHRGKLKLHKKAIVRRRSVEKVLLKISQNSHENTCALVPYVPLHLTRLYVLTLYMHSYLRA